MDRAFAGDPVPVQLSLAAFFVGIALGQAVYGPVADRFGRRRPLFVGCIVYALASVGCALAPSMGLLVAFRFIEALGGCAGMIIARAIARDLFDERGVARLMAMLMLVMGAAPVVAPSIGSQILLILDWRAIFWLLAIAGTASAVFVFIRMPETLPAAQRLPLRIGASLAAYVRLMGDRRFVAYGLPSGLAMAGFFAYLSGSPHVLIELRGVTPSQFGWLFGLNAVALIGASQINHRLLARRSGRRLLELALPVLVVAGLALLAATALPGIGLAGLVIPLFVYIGTLGFILPNASAAAMAPFGNLAGAASSLLGILQFGIGAVIGIVIGRLQNDTAMPMVGTIAAMGIAAAVLYGLLRPRTRTGVAVDIAGK
jgi:DHA1 family bicyclomycin/chloramphenicol resistance-like MFS transporter